MFNSNSLIYNLASENELAVVLGHFSQDYINTIVQTNLDNKLRIYNGKIPNAVNAIEQDFKITKDTYPDNLTDIEYVRATTYSSIINQLITYYDLEYTPQDNTDLYSVACILYNLLVSDFSDNLITFFVNFIIKEKNNLYDNFNLSECKKNKDSSTIYSKKIYKNNKLAAIHANLEKILDNMTAFDITFENYLNLIYTDKTLVTFILSIIKPRSDFFKTYVVPYLFSDNRAVIITTIRLNLLELAGIDSYNITTVKGE